MRAELKSYSSNDTTDWRNWLPVDPSNVMPWFTLAVGPEGEDESQFFQTAVATRHAIDQRTDKRLPFKGLVLDPFEKDRVEPLLRAHVSKISGETWDEIVQELRRTMIWE